MIHVYTGNGKGKTTAALGLIIRMLGREKRVCLIQFMKKNVEYGEIRFLSSVSNIEIFQFGTEHLIDPNNPAQIDIDEAEKAVQNTEEVIQSNDYDLIVLDEINVAVAWKLISLDRQLKLFEIPSKSEVVMTGRYANESVIEKADLVTEMKEVKHYYNVGVNAREGVEL